MNTFQKIRSFFRKYGGYVLIFFHTIGLFLLGVEWRQNFVFLTPYNLLLMLVVFLLASDRPKNWGLYMAPIVLGYIIEVVGTNTGWPFGAYTYGTALGPRVFSTPLMIGVLWWVLIRAWFDLSDRWTQNAWAKSLITGTAMVLMDVLIEPVAIELGFWSWAEVEVPVANYISWFVLATLFARATAGGNTKNPQSPWVIAVLTVFFAALNIAYA